MITIKYPANNNRPAKSCPVCNKPAAPQFRPFCSKRCADIDLGRWLGETYRVPAEDDDDTVSDDDMTDSQLK